MARIKKAVVKSVEEPKAEVKAAEVAVEPKKSDKTEVTVTWRGNSRVYSLAVHGENFEKLAQSFASQYADAVIA